MDAFLGSFTSQRFAETYFICSNTDANSGRWATPEDVLLVTAVQKYGRRWYKVAELVPGRTDDQCAKRWRDKLDPSIRQPRLW